MDKEGILQICSVSNQSGPGRMPVNRLAVLCSAFYRKRTVGYNRMYAAMGANQSISLLVRVFNTEVPSYTQELFVVFPNEQTDNQFRVSMIQEIVDENALDLTLERMEDYYDIATE